MMRYLKDLVDELTLLRGFDIVVRSARSTLFFTWIGDIKIGTLNDSISSQYPFVKDRLFVVDNRCLFSCKTLTYITMNLHQFDVPIGYFC